MRDLTKVGRWEGAIEREQRLVAERGEVVVREGR
jgi:hypothetical protein